MGRENAQTPVLVKDPGHMLFIMCCGDEEEHDGGIGGGVGGRGACLSSNQEKTDCQ